MKVRIYIKLSFAFMNFSGFVKKKEEKKMLYLKFVNLRYAIHTSALKPSIRLLTHSYGLNIFRYYRIWRRVML